MTLYGPETDKSLHNFPFASGVNYDLIKSIILIKKAAALANHQSGTLPDSKLHTIIQVCDTLLAGEYQDQFVTESLQGGAGTSINMNVNEVIANLASQTEPIHPLDDVNKCQSTNDVLPTALRITLLNKIAQLQSDLTQLSDVFHNKAQEFENIPKVGRTHLQDALVITLGQEWHAYSKFTTRSRARLDQLKPELLTTNLGGTAIGTSAGTTPNYVKFVHEHLNYLTGFNFQPALDLIDATQNIDSLIAPQYMFTLIASGLSKIASDLRLLASGPRAGIGEIELPAVQKGSTIMPGKVNPVILEYINNVAFDIAGKNHSVQIVHLNGQLELNVHFPLLAKNLLESAILLHNAISSFTQYASQIQANKQRIQQLLDHSCLGGVARALEVGYEQSEQEIISQLKN